MAENKIRKLRTAGCLAGFLCAFVFLVAPAARSQQTESGGGQAQQDQSAQPIPAYHSPFASASEGQEANDNSQTLQPDTRPLSGAQYISMGSLTNKRSYWQPRVDLSGSADSNPGESTSGTNWGAWASFLAGVDIHHTSGTSDFLLSYTGGGMYSSENSVPNGTVQELGVAEKISLRRSVLSLFDQLSYLPQASLGFGGVGGLPLLGSGSTGLGPGFTTGQSILTGQGQNLANSSVVQLETFLTPRSSITMTGGYSLLHFFGNNLVDSGNIIFQGGYNYQLTRHDTIALLYGFSDFRYNSLDQSIYTHTVEGSYGRRVTGRLAFQIAAGPEIAIFNQGAGTSGGSGASNASSTHAYWSLNTALNYQYPRTALGLTYSHGVGAGSGVLAGSLNDTVTGSLTRQMSRTFSSGLSGGFSRNEALPIAGQPTGQNYNYWFAGASLASPLSETVALTFSYQMQYQTVNGTVCTGPFCGNVIRHLITVGLSWHQRPLLF
jgi:hypothetical protein